MNSPSSIPKLRVGRPTDNISALLPFYLDGLGLQVLYSFENHENFDGVMLGHPEAPYHFEFTRSDSHVAGRAPTPDNLLVFYIPNQTEWEARVKRMKDAGFEPVKSFNPYWEQVGLTFEDPDGWRVVLQRSEWAI